VPCVDSSAYRSPLGNKGLCCSRFFNFKVTERFESCQPWQRHRRWLAFLSEATERVMWCDAIGARLASP
jgi:hypothetical protein